MFRENFYKMLKTRTRTECNFIFKYLKIIFKMQFYVDFYICTFYALAALKQKNLETSLVLVGHVRVQHEKHYKYNCFKNLVTFL